MAESSTYLRIAERPSCLRWRFFPISRNVDMFPQATVLNDEETHRLLAFLIAEGLIHSYSVARAF